MLFFKKVSFVRSRTSTKTKLITKIKKHYQLYFGTYHHIFIVEIKHKIQTSLKSPLAFKKKQQHGA